MNERITQLAQQAREYATTRHPVSNITLSVNSDLFEQKFAELIVRDIYQYVDNMDTAQIISTGILRRYGVEE